MSTTERKPMPSQIRSRQTKLLGVLTCATLALAPAESVAGATSTAPAAAIAKKCAKGKQGRSCRKQKPAKGKISLTNCPSADLVPNVPYTFTGRVLPAPRSAEAIVIQYFDQGSAPLATHTVKTAANGTFSDTYAYPGTGIRRGGTVRANSTKEIDPVCYVTIGE